jgi:hypothetical protein
MHEENWEQPNRYIVGEQTQIHGEVTRYFSRGCQKKIGNNRTVILLESSEKCITTPSIIILQRRETEIDGSNGLQRNNITLISSLSP